MKLKPIYAYTLFVFISLLTIFYLGQNSKIQGIIELEKAQISKRVSLDVNSLPLAEPLFNYAGNQQEVDLYIERLNKQLSESNARVTVNAISTSTPIGNSFTELQANYKTVYVSFTENNTHILSTYIVTLLITLFNVWLYRKVFAKHVENKAKRTISTEVSIKPKLIIDLYTKTLLIDGREEQQSQLANKPLCFYLAMIEFSQVYPNINLHLNKDVPVELLEIAEKYFHRLAVLGHTVRKRPNFSNSLEKTLSEIRASLDEILREFPDLKVKLYPPKAHGEGSRSKLHSYGLKQLSENDYDIRGK
ncbi:MAG: hypothetical protein CMK64_04560 [Pseudoalteromonas sp.]|nr:hypothetical protein [Pseudoalteromonas sp.]